MSADVPIPRRSFATSATYPARRPRRHRVLQTPGHTPSWKKRLTAMPCACRSAARRISSARRCAMCRDNGRRCVPLCKRPFLSTDSSPHNVPCALWVHPRLEDPSLCRPGDHRDCRRCTPFSSAPWRGKAMILVVRNTLPALRRGIIGAQPVSRTGEREVDSGHLQWQILRPALCEACPQVTIFSALVNPILPQKSLPTSARQKTMLRQLTMPFYPRSRRPLTRCCLHLVLVSPVCGFFSAQAANRSLRFFL